MTDDASAPADGALEARLAAVERALTDGETDVDGLSDAAALAARVGELESTVERLDDRVAELEAATRALRGYVGGVRAVNESVERRADAALAAVESLEADLRDGPDPARTAVDAAGASTDAAGAHRRDAGDESADGDGDDDTRTATSADAAADADAAGTEGNDETPRGPSLAARLRDGS